MNKVSIVVYLVLMMVYKENITMNWVHMKMNEAFNIGK